MGFEYNIRYQPADKNAWRAFVERLDNPRREGWSAFDVELTPEGIYFCDNGHSSEAAVAFRRIVDEGTRHVDSVNISDTE